jgi:hypothetical protein
LRTSFCQRLGLKGKKYLQKKVSGESGSTWIPGSLLSRVLVHTMVTMKQPIPPSSGKFDNPEVSSFSGSTDFTLQRNETSMI